ncbi:SelT/SelW/SelH family protein [Vreelandella rituensis]|uniref:SelT/SelW/SelH family protein n=1 Tax=Vreelandella rituensis TaxID=2282306 RepID=A0A368U5K7_9GAMM|nr:SelT/SelW/SelH family protein [Halomonas rituensis]RCV92161.1 SelT/SelW/SelH family protein [Halomonas rituensis]
MSRIRIRYCTQCQWLLRSGWYAQELLSTFGEAITEVALMPSHGGTFEIWCDDVLIWERKRDGGFPDIKRLKQAIRDQLEPGRDLGHLDR